jgi:hypothetical protein
LIITGCGSRPTYPKEQLVQSLQTLLDNEHLKTSVRFIEHTVAVQLEYPDALVQTGTQLGIGPGFNDAAVKVVSALHRVLLSTDAHVWFYVLLLSDPKVPGAYLTMVRYLDDVRRANANMLDIPEFIHRTIFDLQFVGADRSLSVEQYVPRDIQIEDFLTWQLAKRIQQQLTEQFQGAGSVDIGRCSGEFHNKEFAFTLNVSPAGEQPLSESTMQEVFRTSTNVIAQVLSSYQFKSFDNIRLIHPPTGRNLILPKAKLEVFR